MRAFSFLSINKKKTGLKTLILHLQKSDNDTHILQMLTWQIMLSAKNMNLEDHCVTFQDSVFSKNVTVEETGK